MYTWGGLWVKLKQGKTSPGCLSLSKLLKAHECSGSHMCFKEFENASVLVLFAKS